MDIELREYRIVNVEPLISNCRYGTAWISNCGWRSGQRLVAQTLRSPMASMEMDVSQGGGRADGQQQPTAGTRANACLATSLFGTGHRHCHHSSSLQLLPRGWSPGLAASWGPRAGRGRLRN
jgi:hypothetical protein